MTKYFGTDGVRGIANKELSPEMAFRLGRTGGYVLTQHKEDASRRPLVLVARDTRISGQMLADALIAGLLSVGIEVLDLGVITTPAVAYLRFRRRIIRLPIMASSSLERTATNCLTILKKKLKPYWMRQKTNFRGQLLKD